MGSLGTYDPSQYLSPLANAIGALKPIQFNQVQPTNNAYVAKDMSNASLPQYDAMRSRIDSQYNQEQSQGQDAIDRQFAAMGGGPGNGAQLKQTENLASGIAQAKSNDVNNINAEEAQTRTDLQNQQNQMAFQSNEAQNARNAQIGEFNAGTGLQAEQYNQAVPLQAQEALAGMQTQGATDAYNSQVAQYQAQHSGGLFGGGGFLGLGSWFCTEAGKAFPLQKFEKSALSQLVKFAKKKDRDLLKFYLRDCHLLVPKAMAKDDKWSVRNNYFIREIIAQITDGQVEEAYERYRGYLFLLLDAYWPNWRGERGFYAH